jgi:hypothetical protein
MQPIKLPEQPTSAHSARWIANGSPIESTKQLSREPSEIRASIQFALQFPRLDASLTSHFGYYF